MTYKYNTIFKNQSKMLQELPVELVYLIATFLLDDYDLISFRQVCHKTRSAVQFCQRTVEWCPRPENTKFPWKPSKVILNHYVPDDVFGDVLHKYRNVFINKYIYLPWKPESTLTTLTIENVFNILDLGQWTSLQTLVLIGDVRYSTAGCSSFPPFLQSVSLRYLTLPINLSACAQLKSVIIENCSIANFETLGRIAQVQLYRIHNIIEIEHLQEVRNLTLNHCNCNFTPEYLNGEDIRLVYTEWWRYPSMPNVTSLFVMEMEMPAIKAEDIVRCVNLTLLACSNWSVFALPVFSPKIKTLSLSFCERIGQLPDLVFLEHLRLEYCSNVQLGQVPNLKTLFLRDTKINVCRFPELRSLELQMSNVEVRVCDINITVARFPKLREFRLFSRLRCSIDFTLQDLPELRVVHCINDQKYILEEECHNVCVVHESWQQLHECVIMNFAVRNLHYLASVKNIIMSHCDFIDREQLRALQHVPRLTMLSCGINDANCFDHVSFLELSNADINDVSMLTHVRHLSIGGTMVTTLDHLRHIHTLNIDNTAVVELSALTNHQFLSNLSMNCTMVEDLQPLATIPTLRRVSASQCNNIIDANPLQNVQNIDLNTCEQLVHVRMLIHAQNLDLGGCPKISWDDIEHLRCYVSFLRS